VEVVDAAGSPLTVLDAGPFHTFYDMTDDTAWIRATGTGGRVGDTAYYGCSVQLADELYVGYDE
jgi:hypothetical protein